MPRSWSIRIRLLVTFSAITLFGGLLQLFIAGSQLERSTLEYYRSQLQTDALLIAASLAEPLEHYVDDPAGMQATLKHIQEEVGYDYLIVDQDYDVLVYTINGFDSAGRSEETAELSAAQKNSIGQDIRPDSNGDDILYIAAAIRTDRTPIGYVILSQPMSPTYAAVQQGWLELIGASLPVFGLVIAASLWISGTISRPIQELRNSALKMAQGVLETRSKLHSKDEVGQLAQTFNYMAGQIEHLMKQQRSFISNAAHELRTPLMTIKLRAEALNDQTLPLAQHTTYLLEVLEEVEHMAKLVSSLLALARIDEGKHSTAGSVTDAVATLHDVVRRWRIEAEQVSVTLETDISATLPELFISLSDLRLVIDNLLSNALKYTQHGVIHLSVLCEANTFTMVVQDTGIGFTAEQSQHLFDRFYRTEQVRGQFPGNGLGLSIVKAIVVCYKGQVEAQSPGIGHGATFTVCLPVQPQIAFHV